jgi:hypothetical protein
MYPEIAANRAVRKPITAIGVGEECPVVLVEVSGALGVLIAQRRCPGEVLEEVLYFRALMGEPYALFVPRVELVTIDGFSVALASAEEGIFYEPSRVPYALKNIGAKQYSKFVDRIVAHDVKWVEKNLVRLFAGCPGFALNGKGKLRAPVDYASGMDHFMNSHSFIEPKGANKFRS